MSRQTNVILSARRTGKTFTLARTVRDRENAVMVVATHQERQRIEREYKMPPGKVVVAGAESLRGRPASDLFVDNAEWVLSAMLGGHHVEAVTFNQEAR